MGTNEGFVKLHRSFLEWEWYDDLQVKSLFIHLLLKVNHEDKSWHGIDLKRGQHVTSLPVLSKETGLSVQQVRTALKKLSSTGEITEQITTKYRIITVNCYGKYQSVTYKPTDNQQASNRQPTDNQQASNRQPTDKQQAVNRQSTTNKNEKNIKNEKNDKKREHARAKEAEKKRAFGRYGNVLLTEAELSDLRDAYPDYLGKIDRLSQYMKESGKTYEGSHYAVLCRWAKEDEGKRREVSDAKAEGRTYDLAAFDDLTFLNEVSMDEQP